MMQSLGGAIDQDLSTRIANLEGTFSKRKIQVGKGRFVSVRTAGEQNQRPAVVLLHGISSGSASWFDVATHLSKSFYVIAWDAPGYGESSELPDGSPLDEVYANTLHQILEKLNVQNCVVVGHSLGALIASAYIRSYLDRVVKRVVLISPAGGYGAAGDEEKSQSIRLERQSLLVQLGVKSLAEKTATRLVSASSSAATKQWVKWVAGNLNPQGYLKAVELLCESDLGKCRLTGIPIEIYCGDADMVTSPEQCRNWAMKLSAPFSLIPQAGHASPIEQPVAVAKAIERAVMSIESQNH